MNKEKSILAKRWMTPAIHIIVWSLIFYSPVMFSSALGKSMELKGFLHFSAFPVSLLITFYVNYFIFIDLFLFKRHLTRFLLSNILLIAFVSVCLHYWNTYLGPGPGPERFSPPFIFIISRNLLTLTLTAALSVALKVTADWYRREQKQKELEKEMAAAELQNLKSQLNPHFLFNTLNNIYSLTATNQTQAQYAIHSLSKLLRYILYDNDKPAIPLANEISFINSYFELMSLRLNEKVHLSVKMPDPDECNGATVAPLIFITLIENAFKHGVSPTEESEISISIKLERSEKLVCSIINSNFPKSDEDRSGSGIGLENLRKRLALIYPDRYMLKEENDGKHHTSLLVINL